MQGLSPDKTIAVIGAGTMGMGIAQTAAQAGHEVLIHDASEGAVKAGVERVKKGLEGLVRRGKFTSEQCDEITGRLVEVSGIEQMGPASLVIEAVIEDLTIKRELFGHLENICTDAILATNTSSLSITAIAAQLKRPDRFIGMHFFNPAQVMKLVEVIAGSETSAETRETVFATAETWGKFPVHAKSMPGFIVNRVARPFYGEAIKILEEGGTDIATIDTLMEQAGGFRLGPFRLMDLIGNDVNLAVTRSVFEAFHFDPRYRPSQTQQEMVAGGRLGQKSGSGFYDYAENAHKPVPATAEKMDMPTSVVVHGNLGPAAPLVDMLKETPITLALAGDGGDKNYIECGKARIQLTDGTSATELAAKTGYDEWAVFDLALDYTKAERVALAVADQASPATLRSALGLFQALGLQVSVIDDVPGLVVMRTVAMLANEGADAVQQQLCTADAVDTAMLYGVNYPRGPLKWGDEIGLKRVESVLDNLSRVYGDPRYRCSRLIRRKAQSEALFLNALSENQPL